MMKSRLSMRTVMGTLHLVGLGALLGVVGACTTPSDDMPPGHGNSSGGASSSDCGLGGAGSTLRCSDGTGTCTEIVIPEQRCSFTQSEALAGIDIEYQIITRQAVENVFPEPLDAGGCAEPDASGLIVFEELRATDDGSEQYCLCDTGNCAPGDDEPLTLPAGTFDKTFHWEGRSFSGPSDTGEEPGEPFAPGLYVLGLTATGEQEIEGTRQAFDIGAGMTLLITED